MTLNSVVLPDPLGPIRPAIDPFGTDSEHSVERLQAAERLAHALGLE